MQPTVYTGVVVVLVLLVAFARNKVKAAWWVFALCQLFGATSVATLTALGGSSLIVPQVGLIFLMCMAFFVIAPRDADTMRRVVALNWVALALVAYAVLITIFGPRLFENRIDVVGSRPDLFDGRAVATPLRPRPSNITQIAYFIGSILCALSVSIVFARRLSASSFKNAMLTIAVVHALLGLVDWVAGAIGQGRVLDFLRNATFEMLDQEINGVRRLSGALSEPSSFAGFGVAFAVFAIEYAVHARNRIAVFVGLLLWVTILASTSSAGIFSFVCYISVLVPRLVLNQTTFRTKVVLALVASLIALVCFGVSLALPDVFAASRDFIALLTVDKGASDSAIERGQWSAQGWLAFQTSYGLGTGVGSFRSSSIAMAALGTLGVVGSLLLLAYIGQAARPILDTRTEATRRSAAWAALFAIVPGLVGGTSSDPGVIFGMLAGFVLSPMAAQAALPRRGSPRRGGVEQIAVGRNS